MFSKNKWKPELHGLTTKTDGTVSMRLYGIQWDERHYDMGYAHKLSLWESADQPAYSE